MVESGRMRLLTLLFGEERELVNIKFMPGTNPGLTADEMCDAAEKAIRSALRRGEIDNPPMSGRQGTSIADYSRAI